MTQGVGDVVTKLDQGNRLVGQLVNIFQGWVPRAFGTFTMDAAASKTITDSSAASSSYIQLIATNAAAGTLMGSAKYLYPTYANGSFTVHTASGASAAGTETFQYIIFNGL